MGHQDGAHSAADKARKWAIGAIVAGICILTVFAAYLCVYYGYLLSHFQNNDAINALAFLEHL